MKVTRDLPLVKIRPACVIKSPPIKKGGSNIEGHIPRRGFLAASGIGLAAFAMSPLSFGEETKKDKLAQELNRQFEAIALLGEKDIKFREEVNKLIEIGADDKSQYVRWYAARVASDTLKKDSKRQAVLEAIASTDIQQNGFPIIDENNYDLDRDAEENLRVFSNAYIQIVDLNNSSEGVIANALSAVTSLADYDQNSWGGFESSVMDNAMVQIYDAAVKGVKKLPKLDEKIKGMMFQTPLAINQYGSRTGTLSSTMKVLSDNYFGAKQYQSDFEGLRQFLNICIANDYPPVSSFCVYALMDRHLDYFQGAVKSWIEHTQTSISQDDNQKLMSLLTIGADLFANLNSNSLTRSETRGYSSTADFSGISKKSKKDLKAEYKPWADKHIAKPIGDVMLSVFDNREKVKLVVEDVDTLRARERFVRSNSWEDINRFLLNTVPKAPDEFCEALAGKMLARLDDDFSPFHRQKAYETLGISLTGLNDSKTRGNYMGGMEERLVYEPYALGVKGLAYTIAKELEKMSPAGNQYWTFMNDLEKAAKAKWMSQGLDEIDATKLTEAEKLILGAFKIVCVDMKHIRSLMPDRRFPGPTFTRTYRINEATSDDKKPGDRVTIDVTPGINYHADKEYREKGRLINEKVEYSEENRKDGIALRRTWHNAFLFLAYTASQYPAGYESDILRVPKGVRESSLKFKDFVVKFLDDRLRFSLLELDGPGRTEYWGEKIAALTDLYASVPYLGRGQVGNGFSSQEGDIVTGYLIGNREEALAGVFFGEKFEDKNKKSQEIYGGGDSIFKIIEDLEIKPRDIEIMKAGIVEGMFNTAGNKGFAQARSQLVKMGSSYTFSGLLNNPYKYVDSIYDADLQKAKDRRLQEAQIEWQERAKARLELFRNP